MSRPPSLAGAPGRPLPGDGTDESSPAVSRVMGTGRFGIVAGFALILFYALSGDKSHVLAVLFTLTATALAALSVGGFIGFLFGVPRAWTAKDGDRTADGENRHQVNTNLEEVSDWLTKIIVGVSLVQAGEIIRQVAALSQWIAKALPANNPGEPVVAGITLVLFFALGLFFGYLWTRLEIQGAIRTSDLHLFGHLKRRIGAFEDQERADDRAMREAEAIFMGGGGPVDQARLDAVFIAAARPIRTMIYYQAEAYRVANRADDASGNRDGEKTIPIFKALIAADEHRRTEPIFHRNFAQIGFALMHREQPDFAGAIGYLDRAIAVRDRAPGETKPYSEYEVSRAECRIRLDGDFQQGERTGDGDLSAKIRADLETAGGNPWAARELIPRNGTVMRWRDLNPA